MRDKDLIPHIDKVIKNFKGYAPTLEHAIGAYLVGRRVGWKVLYLMHDKKTIRKFEDILKVRFKDEFKEYGDLAHKSIAYNLAKNVSNFWKAVSGEIKVKINGKERNVRDPNLE